MSFLEILLIHQRKALRNIKKEQLKSVIDKGKAHLLGHKWTHERVDKASNEVISKTCAEYKQRELNEKKEINENRLMTCFRKTCH